VKYLSAERGSGKRFLWISWISTAQQEAAEHEEQVRQEPRQTPRKKARSAAKQEAHRADEPGVYYVRVDKLEPLKEADLVVTHDKKRTVLKSCPPLPVVNADEVEIEGASAAFRVNGDRPEFYFRLNAVDGLAIVRLAPRRLRGRWRRSRSRLSPRS